MKATPTSPEDTDEKLPVTTAFVFALGTVILIGWIVMFLLLRARW